MEANTISAMSDAKKEINNFSGFAKFIVYTILALMGATHKLLFDRNFKGARSQNRILMNLMNLINLLKLSSNFREKLSNR